MQHDAYSYGGAWRRRGQGDGSEHTAPYDGDGDVEGGEDSGGGGGEHDGGIEVGRGGEDERTVHLDGHDCRRGDEDYQEGRDLGKAHYAAPSGRQTVEEAAHKPGVGARVGGRVAHHGAYQSVGVSMGVAWHGH